MHLRLAACLLGTIPTLQVKLSKLHCLGLPAGACLITHKIWQQIVFYIALQKVAQKVQHKPKQSIFVKVALGFCRRQVNLNCLGRLDGRPTL